MKFLTSLTIRTICLFGLLFFIQKASADPVDIATAKKVALTQLKQISGKTISTRSSEDMELVYQAESKENPPYFYIFNSDNSFVIVSGDNKAIPILGYSDQGAFDPNNIPPNMAEFLEGYREEIKYAIHNISTRSYNTKQKWDDLINDKPLLGIYPMTVRSYQIGSNLIKTTWSQGIPNYSTCLNKPGCNYSSKEGAYNYYSPQTSEGLRAYTGCGATTVAQIIRYWGVDKNLAPNHGYGSKMYNDPTFGSLSANFENAVFDFSNMSEDIGNLSASDPLNPRIKAIAELMRYCGIALETHYGTSGSSAYTNQLKIAFNNYFGYKAENVSKANYSNDDWVKILKNEIIAERPICYYGNNNGYNGHFFICDGYNSSNLFHINWGWGGQHDGFFAITDLAPTGHNFKTGQMAVINIEPQSITLPSSITITPNDTILKIGNGANLSVTILPNETTNKTVTWTSSNTEIVSVYSSGQVLAKKAGTAIITATTTHSGLTATCTVTVPIPAESITVTPTSSSITTGGTIQLTAEILPSDAADKTVIWSSSNTNIATVDANGLVTAKTTTGTVNITAKSNYNQSKTATATITVQAATIPISGITLTPSTATLNKNQTSNIAATVLPSNATNKGVIWTSSDPTVATVDVNGTITAVSSGNATITATAKDGSGKTATCAVTVVIPVTGISLNKNTTSIANGGSETLIATIAPNDATNQNVTWTSNNTTVATVDANGEVTALVSGTAIITATTVDGSKTATCNVTITEPVVSISLKASTTIASGNKETLIPTFNPTNATNKNVTWTSSNTGVVTVDASGEITAVGGGTATITATTADGGKTATCAVTVTQSVTGVTLNKTNTSLVAGSGTETLTATIIPTTATNQNVTWSSSNTNIVTVDANGLITAGSTAGTATITVTTIDGSKTATCAVTVTQPVINVTGVILNKTSTSLMENGTETLTATVAPSTATNKNVTWSSDNAAVSVDANGTITALSVGAANITVTTVDGNYTATCAVTVNSSSTPVSSVSLNQSSIALYTSETSTLIATIAPATATNQNITWTSSNSSIASVANGVITAISAGAATITATTIDGGFTATCAITVKQYVTSINLNKTSTTIHNGGTETLTTSVEPADATNKNINWSTSNLSVASVTNGVINAVGVGTAVITATANDGSGVTKTCNITVTEPVSSITLSPTSPITLNVGASQTLTTTITPVTATNQNITWSSDNISVATVSNGIITAIGKGSATITATAADGSGKSATCGVTVNQPVTSISLSKTNTTILSGSSEALTATALPANANNLVVAWTSSNTAIATVDTNGNITAITSGTANITATATDGSGVSATCIVTVMKPVTTIALSLTSTTLNAGETEVITPTISPIDAGNQNIIWHSDNTSVATILNGVITATGKGTATITATAADGSGASATCGVTVNQPVTGITLNKASTTIPVGNSEQLTETVQPANANNQNVSWNSDDSSIASVDNSGYVTAHTTGSAIITAITADGSFTASCLVTVTIPVTNVSLDQTALSLFIGNNATLTPNVLPTNASNQNVTWSSDNTSIATVDANGKVSGIAKGTANITVTTVDGSYTATCLVEVMTIAPPIVGVTGISLNKSATSITVGDWEVLTATLSPVNATDQGVTWTSSNPTVATVTSSGSGSGYQLGKVNTINTGTTVITVSTDDGGYTASCTVTITASPTIVSVTNMSIDNPGSSSISQNSTLQLSVTITPSNATNKNVTWTSNNTAVVTVNSNGLITAVSPGTAIITATTQDGSFTDTFTITITSTTGIENIQTTSVWSHDGNIYIKTPAATDIYIFNLAGELVHTSEITEGQHAVSMNRGTYIVTTNNDFQVKVYVK